jgi:hypothetical protein
MDVSEKHVAFIIMVEEETKHATAWKNVETMKMEATCSYTWHIAFRETCINCSHTHIPCTPCWEVLLMPDSWFHHTSFLFYYYLCNTAFCTWIIYHWTVGLQANNELEWVGKESWSDLTFIFQVSPAFKLCSSIQRIRLQISPVPARTSAVVSGWGLTSVRHSTRCCVRKQLSLYQNYVLFGTWSTTSAQLLLNKLTHSQHTRLLTFVLNVPNNFYFQYSLQVNAGPVRSPYSLQLLYHCQISN